MNSQMYVTILSTTWIVKMFNNAMDPKLQVEDLTLY